MTRRNVINIKPVSQRHMIMFECNVITINKLTEKERQIKTNGFENERRDKQETRVPHFIDFDGDRDLMSRQIELVLNKAGYTATQVACERTETVMKKAHQGQG